MKTRDIDSISIHKKAWKKKPKYTKKPVVVGLDTETEHGKAFVIGADDGKQTTIRRLDDFHGFVRLAKQLRLHKSANFFYNLTYDTNALIKHLPRYRLEELAALDETVYGKVHIKIIPEKLLQLKTDGKTIKFYDEAQFYDKRRLSEVARRLLGTDKLDHDVKNLSSWRYAHDEEYKVRLDKYLKRDCELCQRLGEHLYDVTRKYMVPRYFYSQASFSQQYFLENMERDYQLPQRSVMGYALKAYNGGRFEVFKRGTYDDVSAWDIKSAYPYQNVQIPALDNGRWEKTGKYDPEADVSLLKVVAEGKSHVSPMKAENNGLIYYPVGKKVMYVNKKEYETLKLYGYDVRVIDGYHYHAKEKEYPYTFLERFYEEKERVGKSSPEYMFYKITINGFYGKMIQVQKQRYLTDEDGDDVAVIDKKMFHVKERYKAGLLFNPVVAQEITANTRSMLLDAVVDCQDSVIAFATDSIIGTKRPRIRIGSRLGEWEEEVSHKRFTSVGSGVYFFEEGKVRFRGFGKGYDPQEVFSNVDPEDPAKVRVPVTRAVKLKQTFRSVAQDLDRYNLILQTTKGLGLNFDRKREWEDEFRSVEELYEKQIGSKPLRVIA